MSTIYTSAKVEFASKLLYVRADGLCWMTSERKTVSGDTVVGLYLCRQTAERDTYEWLSFRDSGYDFESVDDARNAAQQLDSSSQVPAKSLQARYSAEG